jgi:hypothetical protein
MASDHIAPPATELPVGGWLHNPVTGELAHVLSADEDGRRIEVDLWLQPGAAVAGAHIHDHFVERFDVREGEVGFVKPPAIVQALLFVPLAAIASRTGRDPLAPELHGPAAACAIDEPSFQLPKSDAEPR